MRTVQRFDVMQSPSFEQQKILDAIGNQSSDIKVFIVGGAKPMRYLKLGDANGVISIVSDGSLEGLADIDRRLVWIDGDFTGGLPPIVRPELLNLEWVISLIAHEIGHLIVGPGHPDESGGPAQLDPTDIRKHRLRLMCSEANRRVDPPGIQILKAEWDAAELRLVNDFEK